MSILQLYLGNEAYYLGPNGEPMISTFQSGGFSNATFDSRFISSSLRSTTVTDAYSAWRSSLDNKLYFVPMFDETSGYYDSDSGVSLPASSDLTALELTSMEWWSYWGDVVDGVFSWEAAWPDVGDGSSSDCGSMAPDTPVINGASDNKKSYMIG